MIPDIELQLKVIIKSLQDNVLPAIDANNQLAQEQMHLTLAALSITLDHLPDVHRYIRKDIKIHQELAADLLSRGQDADLAAAVTASVNAMDNAALGFTELLKINRSLRSEACRVIRESEGASDQEALWRCALSHSQQSLGLGRSWNKPHGFEPNPKDIPDINSLLAPQR